MTTTGDDGRENSASQGQFEFDNDGFKLQGMCDLGICVGKNGQRVWERNGRLFGTVLKTRVGGNSDEPRELAQFRHRVPVSSNSARSNYYPRLGCHSGADCDGTLVHPE